MTTLSPFSQKQRLAAGWWAREDYRTYDAVICDGAVRSGKTTAMSLGFVGWATCCFQGQDFALCGRTVTALRRNLLVPLMAMLTRLGFVCTEKLSRNYVDISLGDRQNRFYLFGGKDEGAAALIQGITLAGVLLDETALMPRSFVEQALARCSVPQSKLWFNCNPDNPQHWFYREWICKAAEKNALYLHFTMEDNLSLSEAIRARYRRLYAGVFYDRFILGRWVASAGLIYPMFRPATHIFETPPPHCERFVVSCDYGTVNPTSMGLWGLYEGKWYRLAEYYFSARAQGFSRTDEEHYAALERLAAGRPIDCVVIDPSAASFIECIRRHGQFSVIPAKNDVVTGIRRVCDALAGGQIFFSADCGDCIREFGLYQWNERAGGDVPLKENDHAMDDVRYFVMTILRPPCTEAFYVASLARR